MPELETASEYELPLPPVHPIDPSGDDRVPIPPDISLSSAKINISNQSPILIASTLEDKGATPLIHPSSSKSPTNSIGSDLDILLSKKSLELAPPTIHKPPAPISPRISPSSAMNITVRKKDKRGITHFRGRGLVSDCCFRNLSLVDVPIFDIPVNGPLRAEKVDLPSK